MKKIQLLLLDVDGTLTTGEITYTQSGEEIKSFHIRDGLALSVWNKQLGRKSAIITGRDSLIVQKRAQELGIEHIYMGVSDKGAVVREILNKLGLESDEVACIGDDLNDLPMFKCIKHTYAPKDGAKEIKALAKVVLGKKGGKGAVREMIEDILAKESQGKRNKDNRDELKKYFL
ncbi:KdsC family phosphatase [uncultured Helicobacter sp.]|uniref:KdsC family phosphatase n=1 Tax=uncultured Helicobacter sp. TaxID=175537 RepID=UPI003752F104